MVSSWEVAETRVAEIVREARRIVLQQYRRNEDALLMEILLPAAFLTRAPNSIKVKLAAANAPLGSLPAVVVRMRERNTERADAINLKEWETIASKSIATAPTPGTGWSPRAPHQRRRPVKGSSC